MANKITLIESLLLFSIAFLFLFFLCSLSENSDSIKLKYKNFSFFSFNLIKIFMLFLAIQPLIYLFAERSLQVGTDTAYTYYPYYYIGYCQMGNAYDGIEYGFMALFRFAYSVSNSFNGCLWVLGEILFGSYFVILSKIFSRKRFLISVLVFITYYYFPSFNILRQSFAMMLVLLGLDYLKRNKKIYFIILILVASLFHTSALVCLPILIFDYLSNKSKTKRIISIFLTVLIIISISPIYNFLLDTTIFSKLSNYVLSTELSFIEMLSFAFKGLLFELPIIISFIYLIIMKKRKIEGWDFTIVSMMIAECSFWIISSINPVFMRLSYYFQMSFYWAIPEIMRYYNRNKLSIIVKVVLIIYLLFRLFLFYFVWGYDAIIPYSFA